jgi:hypothetical protein
MIGPAVEPYCARMDEPTPAPEAVERQADLLKERVYITFTSLAVVLTLRSHLEEVTEGGAASTLAITVVGAVLAVFVADFVSHISAHARLPTASEFRHMVAVTSSGAATMVLPLVFVGLAALGVWSLDRALRASAIALIATLVAVGYLAARRARIPVWQKAVVLLAEAALGLVVIGLELLAHA